MNRSDRSRLRSTSALLSLGLSAALLAPSPAEAYPLNPWGSHTATGYFAINPFLYVYSLGGEIDPYLYGLYGISDRFDVIAGVGGYAVFGDDGGVGVGGVELYPRFFVTDSLGFGPHITFVPGEGVVLAPEVDGVAYFGESFALTVNGRWSPELLFGGGGFSAGSVDLLIAPEYLLSSRVSLYLEVDPGYALGDGGGAYLTLVPGVGLATDDDETHTFSIGLQIAVAEAENFPRDNLSLGVWYSTGWGG